MADTVGLIGIGLMGTALARRLIDAGYHVVGFDVDAARREEFASLGGAPVDNVAEVARRAPLTLIAVMTTAQVEDVVEGKGGLIESINSDTPHTALCTSTCEPDRIEALAARAAARGFVFLDTPVSGTSRQVLEGDGFGLIGGDGKAADSAAEVLKIIYPRSQYLGPAGAATKTKLAINHILGLNRVALAEGLVFAETMGLDLPSFLAAARQSAAYSQIMNVKGDKMIAGDFEPVGKLSQHLKDIRTMLPEATRRGQQLPFLSLLREVVEAGVGHGDGDRDNSITIEEIRRRKTSVDENKAGAAGG
jgi:3-hydroxyisobutyrate dehydrogenase-like beta-hydroxyacid dehydrogenase